MVGRILVLLFIGVCNTPPRIAQQFSGKQSRTKSDDAKQSRNKSDDAKQSRVLR